MRVFPLIARVAACTLACAALGLAQPADFPGWPLEWEGAKLRRTPLGAADRACVAGFSGVSARFTDQDRALLFRWSKRPSRTLVSAAACYERGGYHIDPDPAAAPGPGWSCYFAAKTGERLRLCESFYTDDGKRWASADEWLRDALHDRLQGPFWAVIVAERAH